MLKWLLSSFFLSLTISVNCVPIPYIRNTTLLAQSQSIRTIITNQTCDQCLCLAMRNSVALNCFPNNTCEMFDNFPARYKYQSIPNAWLYFPQRTFPSPSQCCMPDLSDLLNKLQNGTRSFKSVSSTRNLVEDNHGYIVTVSNQQPAVLYRYEPVNLTLIDQTTINGSNAYALAYFNNAYYIALFSAPIVVIDSNSLANVDNIYSSSLYGLRSITFANDGQTMIASSYEHNELLVFSKTNNISSNSTYVYQQSLAFVGAHGSTTYNKSRFCVASWTNKQVHCFDNARNSTSWNGTMLFDASTIQSGGSGSFVRVDECDRYWYSSETSYAFVFNNSGSLLGNFSLGSGRVFDVLITDNYIMYFFDDSSGKIIRIDPHINC